ncbi:MAG TPA: hypothetical protein VFO80_09960 [Sphingomonas sp.]|nr:hypothetical protein [Sphingomonas sp.]
MAFVLHSLSVDLHGDKASATILDGTSGSAVSVQVKLPTPGDQPESALRSAAAAAVRAALMAAAAAI